MEIIRSYVEAAFAAYASTPEMWNLKEEILSNMEEKYRELKEQGHSENEAIGTVISEFGNIDELVRELGIYSDRTGFPESPALSPLSEEDADRYLAEKKRNGLLIALGVSLCILSPVFAILTEGFHTNQYRYGRFLLYSDSVLSGSSCRLSLYFCGHAAAKNRGNRNASA